MTDRVVVTGATGFIGRHLVPLLLARGYEVTCIVRDPGKAAGLASQGVSLARGDVTDRQSLVEPLRGAAALFHLAGWYAVGAAEREKMHAINVTGARNALGAAADLGVPRIVHTSTLVVFGNTRGKVVDETYRVARDELTLEYERTKWDAHYAVAVPLQQAGAPLTIVQPGAVIGAGDASPHSEIFRYYVRRMPFMIGPNAGTTMAHVDDIAEGHILAMERGRSGESYVLAAPPVAYRQVFEMCERIGGIPATKVWAPGWIAALGAKAMAPVEKLGVRSSFSSEVLISLADYTFWASADKAKRELGWSPRPLEEALREVLAYEMAQLKT
jgi:nucleoside-diphosphate-sugar epimerase